MEEIMQETSEGLNILNNLTSGEVVTMDRQAAIEKFREYEAAVKRTHAKADEVMAETYRALKDGHGVIHLASALKKGGVHANGSPKLAISRADETMCFFRRHNEGGGLYGATIKQARFNHQGSQAAYRQYRVPDQTFPNWSKLRITIGQPQAHQPSGWWDVCSAPVPRIPPKLRPADARSRYQILWEVAEWKLVAPVDPLLLRPLTHGLAVVVAHWDLSQVERMVMGALLGN
jgi:hypothetical protein